jgi:hypothetical protein
MTSSTLRHVAPTTRLRLVDEAGVRYASAHAGLVLAALVAGVLRVPAPASFVLLTVAALAGGRGLAIGWRAAIALAAWAIWTGFFENTLGLLTFSVPDLVRLTAVVGMAALARSWDRLRS